MQIKKRTVALLILFVALILILSTSKFGTTVAGVYFNKKVRKLPIYSVQTEEKRVAISFDAAWGADKTRDIMTICEEYGVKATFFLVGFWVEDYPEVAKEIADRGFEIGLHSSTHPNMTNLSVEQIKQELIKNKEVVKSTCGVDAKLFRPPYGAYNNALIEVCEQLNLTAVQWSVDSLDWKGLSASQISGRVCKRSKAGSIVLFHNNSDNIIAGIRMVLEFYKNNGFIVGPVGDLVYFENYTINSQGTQIKN